MVEGMKVELDSGGVLRLDQCVVGGRPWEGLGEVPGKGARQSTLGRRVMSGGSSRGTCTQYAPIYFSTLQEGK